jgi:UDP-GlcNAc3NAcA epimerase
MKKKVMTIVGARPQFIKSAPVSLHLKNYFKEILVHTGQHYDRNMSKVFFEELNIKRPDFYLNVGSGTHALQTANIMIKLEKVIKKNKPDLIIVYGDTNSTLAGSLVGAKLNIPIAHIEAGLRSYNKKMPEELNRICTDHYSDILFCPSKTAVDNLKKEGLTKNVFLVGDVMKDALLRNIEKTSPVNFIKKYKLKAKEKYYFFTLHRQENTDSIERLAGIFNILKLSNVKVIFPIHPRTKKTISNNKIKIPGNIYTIDPVNYSESLYLQKNAQIVITDSGGIQKEAYFLGVPCITLRDETEWVETVKEGCNTITGIDTKKFAKALKKYSIRKNFRNSGNLYGDGKASEKIVQILHRMMN